MKPKKKSQSSLEFISLFFILTLILTGILYVAGNLFIESSSTQRLEKMQDLSNYLVKEHEIARDVQDGYSRQIHIPKHISNTYNITIHQEENYIEIKDLEFQDEPGYHDFISFPSQVKSNITFIREEKYIKISN